MVQETEKSQTENEESLLFAFHFDELRAAREARLRGIREGFDAGFRSGREQVLADGSAEEAKEQAKQAEELAQLSKQTRGAVSRAYDALPALAMQVSLRVLEREFHRSDEPFLRLFAQAAAHVARAEHAVLRTSPYGCKIAARHMEFLKKQIDGLQILELRPADGGDGLCILETDAGSVDASLETQFQKAMRVAGILDEGAGGNTYAAQTGN